MLLNNYHPEVEPRLSLGEGFVPLFTQLIAALYVDFERKPCPLPMTHTNPIEAPYTAPQCPGC